MYMMRAFLCFATALVSLVTAASNPTFVLVPGAWHSPVHYNFLISHLESAGFPTVAKRLPSVNSINPKAVSVTTDATFIRNQILIPLLDQGKNVVLVMHSYGGSPGAAAAKGLSKVERIAADQPGGIIGLIFIAALLVPQGVSLKQAVGGKFNDWVVVNEKTGQLGYTNPEDVFYNDLKPKLAADAVSKLLPESENALSTGSPSPAWADEAFNGRRAYIRTLLDHCIPTFAQDAMIRATEVEFSTRDFQTSHSPFLSQPIPLASTLLAFARDYMASNDSLFETDGDEDSIEF